METAKDFGANYKFYISVFVSIFPIISVIGHFFTSEGRTSLKESGMLQIYFVIMPIYSYFYWVDPAMIEGFLWLNELFQFFVYVCMCLGIIIEKKIPH